MLWTCTADLAVVSPALRLRDRQISGRHRRQVPAVQPIAAWVPILYRRGLTHSSHTTEVTTPVADHSEGDPNQSSLH